MLFSLISFPIYCLTILQESNAFVTWKQYDHVTFPYCNSTIPSQPEDFFIIAGLESTHWEPDGQPKATICSDRLSAHTYDCRQWCVWEVVLSVVQCVNSVTTLINTSSASQPHELSLDLLLYLMTDCYTVYCIDMHYLSTWLGFRSASSHLSFRKWSALTIKS